MMIRRQIDEIGNWVIYETSIIAALSVGSHI